MSELKLCSYCKSVPQANTWTLHGISETRYFCPNPDCPHSVRTVTLEQWNRRPIEDALNARIAELEAAQRWIPASERLPQIGVRVLFYNNFITNIHKGWFSGDEWTSDIGIFYNGDKLKRITHWMPLPEPPEVQE